LGILCDILQRHRQPVPYTWEWLAQKRLLWRLWKNIVRLRHSTFGQKINHLL
jgi:hypothetical protein